MSLTKKIMSLVLMTVLAVTVFAGCVSNDADCNCEAEETLYTIGFHNEIVGVQEPDFNAMAGEIILNGLLEEGDSHAGGNFAAGEVIVITAVPKPGYTFEGWYFEADTLACPDEIFILNVQQPDGDDTVWSFYAKYSSAV